MRVPRKVAAVSWAAGHDVDFELKPQSPADAAPPISRSSGPTDAVQKLHRTSTPGPTVGFGPSSCCTFISYDASNQLEMFLITDAVSASGCS